MPFDELISVSWSSFVYISSSSLGKAETISKNLPLKRAVSPSSKILPSNLEITVCSKSVETKVISFFCALIKTQLKIGSVVLSGITLLV